MSQRPLSACTLLSHNYLAHARTLTESYLEQEPGGRMYVLIVDGLPAGVEFGSDTRVKVLDPSDLKYAGWDELCVKYSAVELCTGLKARLLTFLMQENGEQEMVYLDPDILVLKPFTAVKHALAGASIVLTPHMLTPPPPDGLKPSDGDMLISGAYNLGFIALKQSAQTTQFLQWWEERLRDGCRIDPANGLFVDQKWIDLVPSFFDETVILRDPTYNVAYWNLHERELRERDGGFWVNDAPLTFFHFSGFDPTKPQVLSKHQTRTAMQDGTALTALAQDYVARQMANGHMRAVNWGYGYARFGNGIRVNPLLRYLYLKANAAQRAEFGNPFEEQGARAFIGWATTPQPGNRLSPFLEVLYQVRPDVAYKFPDVTGADRARYIRWAREAGAREMGYEPELVNGLVETTKVINTAGGTPRVATAETTKAMATSHVATVVTHDDEQDFAVLDYYLNVWEKERSYRALEQWARELEAAQLEQQANIRRYERLFPPWRWLKQWRRTPAKPAPPGVPGLNGDAAHTLAPVRDTDLTP